jgi:DNA polymerase III gamma/tau subunit
MSAIRKTVNGVAVAARQQPEFSAPYHIKHRPTRLEDVVGNDDVIVAIEAAVLAKNRQHTYFFFGPSGTGKTTLARIVAKRFGCEPANIVEVDAASTSGIDDMRLLTSTLRYSGFGDSPNKAYIVDECHGLSKQAWDSLLKSTEEPPPHAFFFFCSTNPSKIPATMLTRGSAYSLQPVRFDSLMDLLERVDLLEGLGSPGWVLEAAARASQGSPRAALVSLAMIQGARDEDEAAAILAGQGETREVIDLCRAMVKGSLRWSDVQANLRPLADLGAEGIRIQVTLYLAACLMGAKGDRDVPRLLDMLNAFSAPCNQTDKLAPILLAFGRFVDFGQ